MQVVQCHLAQGDLWHQQIEHAEKHETHASLKPANPRESALQRFSKKIMRITLLRRGSIR